MTDMKEENKFVYSKSQYIGALRKIEKDINQKQRAMLIAHAEAPRLSLSVYDIAKAAGSVKPNITYSQYGKLAHSIIKAIDPKTEKKHRIKNDDFWTRFIGEDYRRTSDGLVCWKMHRPLAEAVKEFQWVKIFQKNNPKEKIDHNKWARVILKFLINRIKTFTGGEKHITYGALASAINYPEPHTGSVFSRNIGNTLGVLGHLIENIYINGEKVPQIEALIVNKSKGLPSDGIKEFFHDYPLLSDEKKRDLINIEYENIFKFGTKWEQVLQKLGIEKKTTAKLEYEKKSGRYNPYGSEGSPEHKALRDYIKNRPDIIGLPSSLTGITEYPLKSGDKIDVVFINGLEIIGVEIKSRRSGIDDLERGIFQCIKYIAVMNAENQIEPQYSSIKCILVIEDELTKELLKEKDKLGIEVYHNIKNG